MRIVDASFELLDRRELSPSEKMEMVGRIAYKSEDRIQPGSSTPFLYNKIFKPGHYPVLEFCVFHMMVRCASFFNLENDNLFHRLSMDSDSPLKYLVISKLAYPDTLLISGTFRAFYELIDRLPENNLFRRELISALRSSGNEFIFKVFEEHPLYYSQYLTVIQSIDVKTLLKTAREIRNHLMLAVKLITNRAVTHEIVRHRPCSFLQESQRYCRYSEDKFGNEVTFIKPAPFFSEGSIQYDLWKDTCKVTEAAYLELLETTSPQAARTVLPNSCKTEIVLFATLSEWDHIFYMRVSPAAEPSMRMLMTPLEEAVNNSQHLYE